MIILAIVTFLISRNPTLSLTLLVIACPGAMVISIPVAIVAGIGTLAKHGILAKGGESIEKLAKIDYIAFDKTGTLTHGRPQVSRIICVTGSEESVLRSALIAEQDANHALGKAILLKAQERMITTVEKALRVDTIPGRGIKVSGSFGRIIVGNLGLAKDSPLDYPTSEIIRYEKLADENPTTVFVSQNGILLGFIIIEDMLREDSANALRSLRRLRIKAIHVITGDSSASASRTLDILKSDKIHADGLRQGKADIVKQLRRNGKVAMVGDGINDILALNESDVGIALSSHASEVAMRTADLVILNDEVNSVAIALRISRFTSGIRKQNISISIGTVVFLIFGVLIGQVHMASGMLVHEASVMAVILNALRILRKK
ncbi:MAG: cation-translocating P-type ATPase [Erysipelotrichales bacterium]|nr:MAG: cation-translocating P-type ATPase [Erysipelotrichales bacterium]